MGRVGCAIKGGVLHYFLLLDSLLYFDDLPNVYCNIATYADTTFNYKSDKAFSSWQKIWLASEIEPDLKDLSVGTKSGLEKLHLYISWFH